MSVDAIIGQLVGHDSTSGVIEQDVQAIGRFADLFSNSRDRCPIREVAKNPFCLVCLVLAKLLCDRLLGSLDYLF